MAEVFARKRPGGEAVSLPRASQRLPLQNQIEIAEFVPEITVRDSFVVGGANFFGRHKGAEQIEMAGLGLMQAGEHAVDRSRPMLIVDL
jgi:hypothetical protein